MDTFTDDVIFTLSLYLVPKELANLALVCKRFGYNNDSSKTKKKSVSKQQQQDYPWSLMEEASRRRISAAKNDIQNPYRNSDLITIRGEESWIAVDQRLYLLQHSLVFSKLIGTSVRYVKDDITHVDVRKPSAGYVSIAVCNQVMKSGKHIAEFHVTEDGSIAFGIFDASIHKWPKTKMRERELASWCTDLRSNHGDEYITQFGFHLCTRKGDVVRMELQDSTRMREGRQLRRSCDILTIYKNNEHISEQRVYIENLSWAVFGNKNSSSIRIRPC